MILGYARISTSDQSLDGQTDALTAAGAERIFADTISGTKRERPELAQLLDQLRSGDVVTVTKYDRLARSLHDLLDIVKAIEERGAGFRSLAEDIDTTTPAGRLIFHVFASIAQFERERISERTKGAYKPPASVDVWEDDLPPYQLNRKPRFVVCPTKKNAPLQTLRDCLRLVKIL